MAKGDEQNLRADLDDGHTRVANLLMEALCCAPLTGTEYAVCLYIMRRTYGWARAKNRATGKSEPMTADTIAKGCVRALGSVRRSVQSLVAAKVIVADPLGGNHNAYGMNPDVSQWGLPNTDWKQAKTDLRENRESGIYARKGTDGIRKNEQSEECDLYSKMSIPLSENEQRSTQKRAEVGAVSPTATGAEAVPTDTTTDTTTESTTAPAGASAKQPRKETPSQVAANACLALWSLSHDVLEDAARAAYYKAINALVSQLEGGAEQLQAWADEEAATGCPRVLGTGAKPEKVIPTVVRREVTAAGWQQTFAAARTKGQTAGQRFILCEDGTRLPESKWSATDRVTVEAYAAHGMWDTERGMATDDQRHPSRQSQRKAC